MTRVVVDPVEVQQDGLQLGDPIGCHYHWAEPAEVDAYGDSVRRLAHKVELAVDGFERTATLPEEVFAGEAADALRARAARRHQEAVVVRDHLRGLGRAVNAYSDVLRQHQQGLERLRAFAAARGLEIRGNRIWPPVETIAGDAPQQDLDAWERDWSAYRECFETRTELREARRASARALIQALAEHAGVHPDRDRATLVAADPHQVTFGELRREAAEEALESVHANDRADAAQRTVESLRRREQSALDHLERMVLEERPPAEIQAQADKVVTLHHELGEARVESREADAVADREQAQADRAARHLKDAEAGRTRLVADPVGLRDRLG